MKYRPDPDLDFLKDCTSQELDILVNVLLRNKDGQPRSIVQLPNHQRYKDHAPHHASYWDVIAGEIQRYGSNPLAALARAGRGKHYAKILDNVCARFEVDYIPDAAVEIVERTLCQTLFYRALQHVPAEKFPVVCLSFTINPAHMSIEGIKQTLNEYMRLHDQASCLLNMVVAHGAAMHASGIGYLPVAPKHHQPLLTLFEKPLGAELASVSSLSVTGAAHWIVIPVVLQLAYIRARKNLDS